MAATGVDRSAAPPLALARGVEHAAGAWPSTAGLARVAPAWHGTAHRGACIWAAGPDLLAALRRAVDEELTERQRAVFVAIAVNGVPLDALVIELGSNRNAIYKTLFDARRKLRAALAANGYLSPEISRRS